MIRIYNAKILTMENGMQPFDGEIQIDGSRISYVGEKISAFPEQTGSLKERLTPGVVF